MNINDTYNWLNFIVNKNQSGQITPAQFNLDAERSQIELYNKYFRIFQETREITDALAPFLVQKIDIPDSAGRLAYPADYYHVSSVRRLYFQGNVAIPVEVREIENNELGGILMSQLTPPTNKFPIVSYYDKFLQFYPINLGTIQLDYLRQPTKPAWAYTTVNNRPVYDAANSTDLEFADEYMNEIVVIAASYYGVYLSSQQLVQAAEMFKAQNV